VTPAAASQWRELARRTGNGVEVALLWNRSVNRVKVAVIDGGLCHHLDFDLAGDDGLRAFSRPFGDATRRLGATDLSAALSPRATDEFWGFSSS
jgi:hypothetical protein